MKYCKLCGGEELVKNGRSRVGQQRYKCKTCKKTIGEGDGRVKYDIEKRIKVMKMYLEGIGLRSIERLENVSTPLIIQWIRGFSKMIRKTLNEIKIPEDGKSIEILELDELFTYCQKKHEKSIYGLLLIGTEIKLLQLK